MTASGRTTGHFATIAEEAAQLAERFGEALGTEALGYPTSWIHQRAELDKVKQLAKKKELI